MKLGIRPLTSEDINDSQKRVDKSKPQQVEADERPAQVNSLCGAMKLLAAMFGLGQIELVKLEDKFAIPPQFRSTPRCLQCHRAFRRSLLWNGLCDTCNHEKRYIDLVCDECGTIVKRTEPDVLTRLGKRRYQHVWCSKHCQGKWAARNFGFGAPGGIDPHVAGGGKRKHDYEKVWQEHLRTGWGSRRLSRLLGISESSIERILRVQRKAYERQA